MSSCTACSATANASSMTRCALLHWPMWWPCSMPVAVYSAAPQPCCVCARRAATLANVVAMLDAGGSVLAALEALLRLRQACCHPGLLPGHTASTSTKVALLLERLEEAVANGHKARGVS